MSLLRITLQPYVNQYVSVISHKRVIAARYVTTLRKSILTFYFVLQPSIRSLTIRVIKDMIRAQPYVFHEVSGTTISKILQAHKDPQKEVRIESNKSYVT